MELVAGRVHEDPALDTLLLPFAEGALEWPPAVPVAFLRARPGKGLPGALAQWVCEQSFRPFADALRRCGIDVVIDAGPGPYALVTALPPRQRDEARALLARAVQLAGENGVVLASVANDEGARSAQSDLARLAGPVTAMSKNHCRVFWSQPRNRAINATLLREWLALDAPRPIADGRYVSRPGLFAWDRIDSASALLVCCLPVSLGGAGADLGAGFGYLSAEVISRCPGVTRLSLFEAEARALDLARINVRRRADNSPALDFHWHDVATGIPGRYDFIVSNPPFHESRISQPELGRSFIASAAAALTPGGSLWLVANRHLPYEAVLAEKFANVRLVRDEAGFKVFEAVRGKA